VQDRRDPTSASFLQKPVDNSPWVGLVGTTGRRRLQRPRLWPLLRGDRLRCAREYVVRFVSQAIGSGRTLSVGLHFRRPRSRARPVGGGAEEAPAATHPDEQEPEDYRGPRNLPPQHGSEIKARDRPSQWLRLDQQRDRRVRSDVPGRRRVRATV
jgi:hypothetical protein